MSSMAEGPKNSKIAELEDRIRNMGRVLVAFSGGVDSTLLARVSFDVLGADAQAVTILSPLIPSREGKLCSSLALRIGIRHRYLESDPLSNPTFRANPPDRCALCKRSIFKSLIRLAREEGLGQVLEGSNHDDLSDARPGMRAAHELGVRSLLLEVGLNKDEIRLASRELGLENWDLPASACLASRIPFGEEITNERLRQVDNAEEAIRDLGFTQVRVRHHGHTARIELLPEELVRFFDPILRSKAVQAVKDLGYNYISLDLEGYRTGALNEPLQDKT